MRELQKLAQFIPGFRSDVKWKKWVASIYYIATIPVLIFLGYRWFLFMLCGPYFFFGLLRLLTKPAEQIVKIIIPVIIIGSIMAHCLISEIGVFKIADTIEKIPKITQITNTDNPITATDTDVPESRPTIQEQILFENDMFLIKAVSIDYDGYSGPEINIYIENNSELPVTLQAVDVSVNGLMQMPFFSCDVEPGKKANDKITLLQYQLDESGVEDIGEIELSFNIFEQATWETIILTDTIIIPTSVYDSYEQVILELGDVLYEDEDCKITFRGYTQEENADAELKVFIENNSDIYVTVQVRNMSVNEYMTDPIFSCDISPYKKAYDSIIIPKDTLQDNNIAEIAQIEFRFFIFNSDDWSDIVETDMILIELD